MKYRATLLLLFLALFSQHALLAQDEVDIGIGEIQLIDTFFLSPALPVQFYLVNYGDTVFDDEIDIFFNYEDDANAGVDTTEVDESEDFDVFIMPGDSVLLDEVVDVDFAEVGLFTQDIIIIWPDREDINDTNPTNDYNFKIFTVFENFYTNIQNIGDENISLKVNGSQLLVSADQSLISNIRIFDLAGIQKANNSLSNSNASIQIGQFTSGIYVVEVATSNKRTYYKKIVLR